MNLHVLDTEQLYTALLALPVRDRAAFFHEKFRTPFAPMCEKMGMPLDSCTTGCLKLSGADGTAGEMLALLRGAGVWQQARRAVEFAANAFKTSKICLPDEILLGIFLADPDCFAQTNGYSGVGSCPGYIQIMIAPNSYNLPRLPSCIAHEFHHNVLFYNVRWNFMNVRLSQYLAVEGLAESFAAALYGEEFVGPWAANISGEALKKASAVIGRDMDTEGFMQVRTYMYGDHPMVPKGKELGIAYCAGYAVGYRAVQAYLRKTSKTVCEATKAFIDGEDIVKQSGFF